MTIGSHEGQDIPALLRFIFAESSLRVTLAGDTEVERGRKIAFYDEIINVCVRLTIPASHRTIPAPANTSQHAFSIPLEINDDFDDEAEDQREQPPLILAVFVASLRVALEAAYVPPRLARGAASRSIISEDAGSSDIQLIPSVDNADSAYQDVSLQTGTVTSEATRMIFKDWAGNAAPPRPELKKPCSKKGKDAFAARAEEVSSANVWYGKEAGVDSWIVEWRCDVPIVFLRSRHPTPALVLNATLTLVLQSSKLSALAPSLVPPTTTSASEAVFLHDLLNPLSEGPAYPDESPAERAARADASLAKLPLGKLPSSILGSKLITPARGANELAKMLDESRRKKDGGDVGSLEMKDSGTGDVDKGLGEEAVIVRRSARKALDVRSAVQVRMRTTNIAGTGEGFGQSSIEHGSEPQDSIVPTLILCVEIENPTNSGIEFALDDVGVHVAVPSESYGALHPASRIQVTAAPIGFMPDSLLVAQGSQYNLLFRVDFAMPAQLEDSQKNDPMAMLTETQRTITIELFGHPVFLQGAATATAGESFTSTWSCTLDFVTQIQALVLQQVVADGAGGTSLGNLPIEPGRAGATTTSNTNVVVPPSIVAQRRLKSLQQLDMSVASRDNLPLLQTQNRAPSAGFAPSRMTPARAASVLQNGQSFVSLKQNGESGDVGANIGGGGGGGPALPSSMIGPSILARARKNRHATIGSTSIDRLTSSQVRGQRSATLVSTPTGSYDQTGDGHDVRGHRRLPSRVTSTSYHVKNAMSGTFSVEALASALPVFPLGSKGSWTRMPSLLRNAANEHGLLLDVTAVRVNDLRESSSAGQSVIDVQIQIDNRSDVTRTVLLQWKRQADLLGQGWMPSDDAVQVGPIAPGQAELSMMRLTKIADVDTFHAPYTIPPLILTDIGSGVQRTLISVQHLC